MKKKDEQIFKLISQNKNYFRLLENKQTTRSLRYNIIRNFPEFIKYMKDSEIDLGIEKALYRKLDKISCLDYLEFPSEKFLLFLIKHSPIAFIHYLVAYDDLKEKKKEYLFKILGKNKTLYELVLKGLPDLNFFLLFISNFNKYNPDNIKTKIEVLKDLEVQCKEDSYCVPFSIYKFLFDEEPKFINEHFLSLMTNYYQYFELDSQKSVHSIRYLVKIKRIIKSKENNLTFDSLKKISFNVFLLILNKKELFNYIYNDILNENFYKNIAKILTYTYGRHFNVFLSDIFSLKEILKLLDKLLKYYDKKLVSYTGSSDYIWIVNFFSYYFLRQLDDDVLKKILNKYLEISFINPLLPSNHFQPNISLNFFDVNYYSYGTYDENNENQEDFFFKKIEPEKKFYYLKELGKNNQNNVLQTKLEKSFVSYYFDPDNDKEKINDNFYNFLLKNKDSFTEKDKSLIKRIINRFSTVDYEEFKLIKLSDDFINFLMDFLGDDENFLKGNLFLLFINSMDFNDLDKYPTKLCKFILKNIDSLRIKVNKEGRTKKHYKQALIESKL